MTTAEHKWCRNHCLLTIGNRLTIVKIVEVSLLWFNSLPLLSLDDDERYIIDYEYIKKKK